ncbi:uncharacterized protein FOMMEDRAFT_134309 [Fomitiporia mediterranea MF3/22]|uniref:uncharacterized protein n=1 Tax=Fomitiporia mediterranea (strain MF3/22) TaxID=694068 RepID=UPI0004409086|nr:uncharacterized protein FOMMEDRAFT_134309 [Fomitiporia mediterranea MF3/22]EJD03210.1 hypothetical protein FOMMEDRAFT_134309 [Fomitiporia mediterranea MF3/22]
MYEPIRGGTRGGQGEFKWSDVSADKDREHYLGHSINAPTGRWQKNKDVHWYNRDQNQAEEEKLAEIKRIKEAEADAMAQMLGFAPTKKTIDATPNGNNSASPVAGTSGNMSPPGDDVEKEKEKLERHRRKMEKKARKAEKKARKETKRMDRRRDDSVSDYEREDRYGERRNSRERRRSRSRSPRRRDSREWIDEYRRRRSPVPPHVRRRSKSPASHGDERNRGEYDLAEQERERERDRRRWNTNAARDLPRSNRPR